MEYASTVRTHASKCDLGKLENVLARAAKNITGAMFYTKINKGVLIDLKKRRKYNVLKFSSKVRM